MVSLLHDLCKDEGKEEKLVDYVEGFPERGGEWANLTTSADKFSRGGNPEYALRNASFEIQQE